MLQRSGYKFITTPLQTYNVFATDMMLIHCQWATNPLQNFPTNPFASQNNWDAKKNDDVYPLQEEICNGVVMNLSIANLYNFCRELKYWD